MLQPLQNLIESNALWEGHNIFSDDLNYDLDFSGKHRAESSEGAWKNQEASLCYFGIHG